MATMSGWSKNHILKTQVHLGIVFWGWGIGCGCYAEARPIGLTRQCGPAGPSKGGRYRLGRFLRGLHPTRDVWLGGPYRALPSLSGWAGGAGGLGDRGSVNEGSVVVVDAGVQVPACHFDDPWAEGPGEFDVAFGEDPWPEGPPDLA